MDIRRIPLWESRNATYMSNNLLRTVIEDQGEVAIELSAAAIQGGFVNAVTPPYFRGRGAGVLSDPNSDWWKGRSSFYQAGGIYVSFPSKDEDHILTTNTSWLVRRYGSDGDSGGVWRLSTMKSREEGQRYHAYKVDLLLPGHPVLYSLVRIVNSGEDDLSYNASVHAMLTPPFLESGCLLSTSGAAYTAFAPNFREVAFNRMRPGQVFGDLRHAPAVNGANLDAGYIPGPTGSYDYIVGQLDRNTDLGWTAMINPRLQMVHLMFFPSVHSKLPDQVMKSPHVDVAYNLLGRMDSPWALYEGGTGQVFSLTVGHGRLDHHGVLAGPSSWTLKPGGTVDIVSGQAFTSFDNPRLGGGFYTLEHEEFGLVLKRTKSYAYIQCDYEFRTVRELADRLSQNDQE